MISIAHFKIIKDDSYIRTTLVLSDIVEDDNRFYEEWEVKEVLHS